MFNLLLFASIFFLPSQAVRLLAHHGHVVIVAPPLFGHIIPSLDFAKHLSFHHHVTYVVSASKLVALERRGLISSSVNGSKNSTSVDSSLEFVGLLDDNNEENEVFDSKPTFKIESIIDRMREPLTQLLSSIPVASSSSVPHRPLSQLLSTRRITRPVHLIISPFFNYIPAQIAHQRRVHVQIFLPNSLECIFRFIDISTGNITSPTLDRKFVQNVLEAFSLADGLICNSIFQLDKLALDRFREQSFFASDLPVRFVGPLFSEKDMTPESETVARVTQWLDVQWNKTNGSSSVIYIAFGSMARLTAEQIAEISRVITPYPCIWSLKSDLHKHVLLSRGDDQMHLVLNWTPQRLILSHPAVHFFVSHGGWNSILESIFAGKPMLVWPMFGDQFDNGNRVEHDFGIGQVIRNTRFQDQQRLVPADELAQHFQHMFDRQMPYVQRARQLQTILQHARENTSREHFDEIVKIINDEAAAAMMDIHKEEL